MKGAVRPRENDSAWLLDPHSRRIPGQESMRRFRHDEAVDILIVGAGAGGCTLAQRLARAGWRVLVLEAGPFWDPDRDWVSDEAGAHELYWTEPRVIGGEDPVELIEDARQGLLEVAAGFGRHDLARAPVEEADVELALEVGHEAADGRLREMQGLRRAAEMPVAGDGQERPELSQGDIHAINVSLNQIKRIALSTG